MRPASGYRLLAKNPDYSVIGALTIESHRILPQPAQFVTNWLSFRRRL